MTRIDLDPPFAQFIEIAERSLLEDLGSGDPTGASVGNRHIEVCFAAREAGVIAGLVGMEPILSAARQRVGGPPFELVLETEDGCRVTSGEVLGRISGPAALLLAAERSMLNLLCHLSGIATLTAKFVQAVEGSGARIRDTRKTLPGLRVVEKYAVRCGGGHNHRMGLYDAVLIKDNHVAAFGGIAPAVAAARKVTSALTIEVEVDTLEELEAALAVGCDLVLLDNMGLAELSLAVAMAKGKARTEASGGVTLRSVAAIAATGVDFIAVGALTHSAVSLDIGLDWMSQGQ